VGQRDIWRVVRPQRLTDQKIQLCPAPTPTTTEDSEDTVVPCSDTYYDRGLSNHGACGPGCHGHHNPARKRMSTASGAPQDPLLSDVDAQALPCVLCARPLGSSAGPRCQRCGLPKALTRAALAATGGLAYKVTLSLRGLCVPDLLRLPYAQDFVGSSHRRWQLALQLLAATSVCAHLRPATDTPGTPVCDLLAAPGQTARSCTLQIFTATVPWPFGLRCCPRSMRPPSTLSWSAVLDVLDLLETAVFLQRQVSYLVWFQQPVVDIKIGTVLSAQDFRFDHMASTQMNMW